VICSALVAYTTTPAVRVLAFKIGAIDVPLDKRRMHKKPVPRIGGLAIFASFVLTTLIFCETSDQLWTIWLGGAVLIIVGILDDVFRLPALVKLVAQIGAAFIAVAKGVVIDNISIGGKYIVFGNWGIPITVFWIVGLTNAINLIDGLDGLACGVSAICSSSLFFVILLSGDIPSALIVAILAASCFGFLPFNKNPARIFMGDTGALFLGYSMAIISISGVFKLHTLIAFLVPMAIFALPLLDTGFAFIRRLIHGRSPFSADRGHLHHRLVDMGFTQKNAVRILYAITALLGLVAVVFTYSLSKEARLIKALFVLILAIVVFLLNYLIIQNPNFRVHTGLFNDEPMPPKVEKIILEVERKAKEEEEQKDTDEKGDNKKSEGHRDN
jgi:UDP-GlcNAc:undecaprenyl-phosphate GlcNAc-1-phosphate transferase